MAESPEPTPPVGAWDEGSVRRIDRAPASSSAALLLGAWLRAVRIRHRRRLADVASTLRTGNGTVSRAERGQCTPHANHIAYTAQLDSGSWGVSPAEAVAIAHEILRLAKPPYPANLCVDAFPGWRERLAHLWATAVPEFAFSTAYFPQQLHTSAYATELAGRQPPYGGLVTTLQPDAMLVPTRTVVNEVVLLRPHVSPDVMIDQIDYVADSIRGGRDIGIMPLRCHAHPPWGEHNLWRVRGHATAVDITPVSAVFHSGSAADQHAAAVGVAADHALEPEDTLARLETARTRYTAWANGQVPHTEPGPPCTRCTDATSLPELATEGAAP